MFILNLGVSLCIALGTTLAMAHEFMPENTLHLEKFTGKSNVTKAQFDEVIDRAEAFYKPIIRQHGASLQVNRLWDNDTVNASALRQGRKWVVNMYGGLARRPEVTVDGFALVVCHELGHHLGGFPQVGGLFNRWAANEGQSDYFATLSCARELWKNDTKMTDDMTARVDPFAKAQCDDVWQDEQGRALCYRIANASYSLATLLARGERIAFNTPSPKRVRRTDHNHPEGQCRLDTMMAGALCTAEFDAAEIPATTAESRLETCMRMDQYRIGVRPLCWFAP